MKVLVLFPRKLWETRLSASRRHDILALSRRVKVDMTGQGWSDWRDLEPAVANIERIMPDADVVLTYKVRGNSRMNIPSVIGYEKIADRWLVAQRWQECAWWKTEGIGDACRDAIEERVGLIVVSHPCERWVFAEAERRGATVVTIAHCAEARVFRAAARRWQERDINLVVSGAMHVGYYPLRVRMQSVVTAHRIEGAVWHPHPGCRAESVADAERKVDQYARMLGRSKISFCCSSRYRLPLAKYIESAMAGCCVMGDMPDDPPEEWENFIVPVSGDATEDELADKARELLADDEGLKAKANLASETAHWGYTMERWCDRFLAAVEEAKR